MRLQTKRPMRFLAALALSLSVQSSTFLQAQVLADFETDPTLVTLTHNIDPTRFVLLPDIYENPDTMGINPSELCYGYSCRANLSWSACRIEIRLATPVTIDASNRMLSMLMYRTNQSKDLSVGFNAATGSVVYTGQLYGNDRWERIVIDLGTAHLGETLESIWITNPMSGPGVTAYYFDDITLSSTTLPTARVSIGFEMFQEIDDFGASDCWTGNFIGRYWSENTKSYIAEKLFSQEFDASGHPKGVGLSNWRINLGAGTEEQGAASGISDVARRSECFLLPDGTYDWSKQSGQQYFMRKAKEYGVENFLLFSNSPPVYFTKNGKGYANSGESGSNLRTDKYGDFAEFMTTVAEHFVEEGYNIKYISPINEPQYDWSDGGQEGSPWQNAQIKSMVQALNNSLQERNSEVKILVPEAGSYTHLYSESGRAKTQIRELFRSGSTNYIGNLPSVAPVVAGHSYWTFGTNKTLKDVRTNLWNEAKTYNLKTYQTEWSMLDAAPTTDTGFPASYGAANYMDIALFMGKLIYCDMAYANTSSWSYWTALSNEVYSQKNRFFLIKCTPGNGAYGSWTNPGSAEASLNLWVLGNYSLFVRPGYRRIRMDGANEMNHLLGTAYICPYGQRLVTVYVNTANTARTIDVDLKSLQWFGLAPVTVQQYTTNQSNGSLKRNLSAPENTGMTLTIPARSVSTIVYGLALTAIEDIQITQNETLILSENPVRAGSEVTITLPFATPPSSDKLRLRLASLSGSVVSEELQVVNEEPRETTTQSTIRVPNVQPGIYMLTVTNGTGKTHQQKLIITAQ